MINSKIYFNKHIYSKEMITLAIKAYSQLADISFSENQYYYECSFSDCLYDIKLTQNEFCNYMISLLFAGAK